ncbi:hypothetical protein GGI11_004787, partial [Coemansia sp. RSA 2049]
MRGLLEERWRGRCSGLDLSDIKSFLQRAKCFPGTRLPGQRIAGLPPLPPSAQFPSILRRTDYQQEGAPALNSAIQRRVTFDLPPPSHDSASLFESADIPDASDEESFSYSPGAEKYICKGTGLMAEFAKSQMHENDSKLKVQRIPKVCFGELIELGSLDRILSAYSRELGRMAINNYRPFRSMYFYSIVIYHIGKHQAVDFAEAVRICETAVVLNNVITPINTKDGGSVTTPNLLSFLDLGVDLLQAPVLPIPDDDLGKTKSKSWKDISLARMEYAMPVGQLIANLEEPTVLQILSQHISKRCVIRPVYNYMYRSFLSTHSTCLPVVNASFQFQIYSTVREIIEKYHGPNPALAYVMYTTLFAIVETNEIIVREVLEKGGSVSEIHPTVYGENEDDGDSDADTVGDGKLSEPLNDKELLSLIDWDLAAVIGYVIAQRYHKSDESATTMRARLGAMALG